MVWVMTRWGDSSFRRSIALVVLAGFHCDASRRVKAMSRSPASSRLSATARHLSLHLRKKALRRLSISAAVRRSCRGSPAQFVVQALGGMRQEVPVLVNRTAVDGQVLAPKHHKRGFEAGSAVAALAYPDRRGTGSKPLCSRRHVPDRQKHFRSVTARRSRPAPRYLGPYGPAGLDHGAVEDEPHDLFAGQIPGRPGLQSTFTLRHVRLTTSFLTAPSNRPNSARLTRRMLVPAKYTAAINASALFVSRL